MEITCPNVGHDRWDQHSNLKDGHEKNCLAVDQPIFALITDLKARGLLDSTLILWAGEFGRTPFARERMEEIITLLDFLSGWLGRVSKVV